MSVPATEIAVMTLKSPGTAIEDESTPDGGVFKQILGIIGSQPGFQRQYWGRQIEDARKLVLAVDWDDLSYHRTWMLSPSYNDFLMTIAPLLDLSETPQILHINAVPHPPSAPLDAPVTELSFLSLSANGGGQGGGEDIQETKTKLEDRLFELVRVGVEGEGKREPKEAGGKGEEEGHQRPKGLATGWVMEQIDHPHAEPDPTSNTIPQTAGSSSSSSNDNAGGAKEGGGKAITLAALIGWSSKEAHVKATESEAFARAAQPLTEIILPPLPGRSMYHVAFTRV